MNELEIKTIQFEPAKIEFNKEVIEQDLKNNLAKYEGVVFSEDSTTELRSTIAYLRKGKRAVDDYRKEIKKKLTDPVKAFEEQCKDLTQQFDSVIDPLNEQLTTFVERERTEKQEEIEAIRESLIKEHELSDEYHDKVIIEPQYLNKSTSIRRVTDSIEFVIKNLKFEQEKMESDKKNVSMLVRVANAENGLGLSEAAYINLLEVRNVEEVEKQISADVEKELEVRAEAERKESEIERNKQADAVEAEADDNLHPNSEPTPISIDDLPFDDPFADFDEDEEVTDDISLDMFIDEQFSVRREYEVFATETQLNMIEEFMTKNNIKWGKLND